MADQPSSLPTTEEQRPPTEEPAHAGRPLLLAAFPEQVAVELPRQGEVVGRAWLATAGVIDAKVSAGHLRFLRRGNYLHVEDLASRNGTTLNGVRLAAHTPAPLPDGAILEVGSTILVFREAFFGPTTAAPPLGELVGPWGLWSVQQSLHSLPTLPVLNVLIEGATGTGKELLAREIARRLGRGERFVPVNVANIPRELFDGHLFGWRRGAFSGGVETNVGLLRANEGGAVFLDELEALPFDVQPKLLRFLQFREVSTLGAARPSRVDLVVIGATNRPLASMVGENAFRSDLAARFNVRLHLPPLKDRPEDIYAIFEACWRAMRGTFDRKRVRIDADAVAALMRRDWPENVRELERLVMSIDPAVGLRLPAVMRLPGGPTAAVPRDLSKELIVNTVAECKGNKSVAAQRLGISRGMLLRLLKE